MSLPQINEQINYIKTKLPSGKSIGVCGWKVKEEKELLFALEIDDNEDNKTSHIINLLKQCVDDKVKFDTLSENDLKKITMETRKLAKGETIEYNYECPHCKAKFFDEVNVGKEQEIKPFDATPLTINERLILTFKDLSWKVVEELFKDDDMTASKFTFKYLINSVDSITFDEQTYTEFTPEECENFIDQLDPKDLKTLYDGFESKLSKCDLKRSVKCLKCKEMVDINFGDLLSFLVF
jgi:hypothetical protein